MEDKKYPEVDPNGFCAGFDRCCTSLIEEPETCDVCNFYSDKDGTCRRERNKE